MAIVTIKTFFIGQIETYRHKFAIDSDSNSDVISLDKDNVKEKGIPSKPNSTYARHRPQHF